MRTKGTRPRILVLVLGLAGAIVLSVGPSSVQAHVTPVPCDWTHISMTLTTPQGGHSKAVAEAGCKDGAFIGKLSFEDKDFGPNVDSHTITGYLQENPGLDPSDDPVRIICGIATVDGVDGVFFRVRAYDGQHGGGSGIDTFAIRLSTGYYLPPTAGDGKAGNIVIQPTSNSTPPASPPDEFTQCNGMLSPP